MTAYYNEIDPYAAAWLRNLIAEGLIPDGVVDERSITDVQPADLVGFTQCHFFAGLGGWGAALRLAGWPDDRSVWTGSCPCQPFSVAGKGAGTADARHLWPDFFRLIRECRPAVVVGEQVSAAAGKRTAVDAHMHGMWRGEDLSGFLPHQGISRQFDWLSCSLQSVLPQMAGELQEWLEGADVGFFSEIQGEEPRAGTGLGRALSGEAGAFAVRSGRVAPAVAGADRQGALRDERPAVSSGWRQDVGQPVARPDNPGAWLHDFERAGGPVWAERHDEHLGRGNGASGSGSAEGGEAEGGPAPAGGVGAKAKGAAVADWLDGVAADLDDIGYSFGSVDIPACAVDAPHIRSRLYWIAVANADQPRSGEERKQRGGQLGGARGDQGTCAGGDVADSDLIGQPHERVDGLRRATVHDADRRGERVDLGDTLGAGLEGRAGHDDDRDQSGRIDPQPGRSASPTGGRNGTPWSDHVWLSGADGKARRAQPGVRLLAHGIPARVGKLRALGNAIVPQVAAEVVGAYLDTEHEAGVDTLL